MKKKKKSVRYGICYSTLVKKNSVHLFRVPRRIQMSVTERFLFVVVDQYLFLPPNRYIFHGAEFFSDPQSPEYDTDLTADTPTELVLSHDMLPVSLHHTTTALPASRETTDRSHIQEPRDTRSNVEKSCVAKMTSTDSCVPSSTVSKKTL